MATYQGEARRSLEEIRAIKESILAGVDLETVEAELRKALSIKTLEVSLAETPWQVQPTILLSVELENGHTHSYAIKITSLQNKS